MVPKGINRNEYSNDDSKVVENDYLPAIQSTKL